MKGAAFALGLLLASSAASGQVGGQIIERAPSAPLRVQLDSMPLGALATLLMRDVMKVPYVIGAEVLNDNRPVSVNLAMPRGEIPVRVVAFLRSMGLTVTLRGGTVYVTKAALGSAAGVAPGPGFASSYVPSGNPLAMMAPAAPPAAAPGEVRGSANSVSETERHQSPGSALLVSDPGPQMVAIITPAHRPVIEFVDVLESVLPQLTIAARRDSAPRGPEIVDKAEPDDLVLSGSPAVVKRAVDLVRLLDKPRPVVEVKAVVFEVRTSSSSKSALSLLASLGGLQLGASPGAIPGEQFVRFAAGGLNAILSATKGDGRFKIIAEPSLAVVSGSSATINSGSEVPTVGAVTFSQETGPVRSIVYRNSGVSLTVRPVVRAGEIELAVNQERSSFVRTTTGVDESPTLNTSKASATVAIKPGETIAIAGLDERSEGAQRSGFLGGILGGKSSSKDQGQLLLLLQASLSTVDRTTETGVRFLGLDDSQDTDEKPVKAKVGA